MKNLLGLKKGSYFKIAAHILFIIGIVIGTLYIFNKKEVEYRSDRDAIVALYESQIKSKNQESAKFAAQQIILEHQIDSLENVKQKIIIKYDQKADTIADASAAEHALWLDSILEDLDN